MWKLTTRKDEPGRPVFVDERNGNIDIIVGNKCVASLDKNGTLYVFDDTCKEVGIRVLK